MSMAFFQNKANNAFELVVREGNQLRHYWFAGNNWQQGQLFGSNVTGDPVMFQNFDGNNFEVVVRETHRRGAQGVIYDLVHYWFPYGSGRPWQQGQTFDGSADNTQPVMLQNRTNKAYELVVPLGNQLRHYWFTYGQGNNWQQGLTFG